MTKMTIYWH